MRSPTDRLTVGQALALGALHGPAELLPVSSSAHTAAIPWLLGWEYAELEPDLRKSFEVALHAGAALALAIALRDELGRTWKLLGRERLMVLGLACAPAAIAGYALERPIEKRMGTPGTIAGALLGGAALMVVADPRRQDRSLREAGPRDGLWLGIAQASALIPGISRAGATRATARLLGFGRRDATLLSVEVGMPILVGATLLKTARLYRRGIDSTTARAFAAAGGASFASTLASAALLRRGGRAQRLLPYAAYRLLLASMILIRQRQNSTALR